MNPIALTCLALLLLGIPKAAAAPGEDAATPFFAPEILQTIHLEIAPEDLDHMQRALPERIYVPGTFRWKDRTLQRVGVRYKGDSSSAPNSQSKRSFLVAFSQFTKGQRFLGLHHVALDNGIEFGSLFSERLITDVLREVGVPSSRCNYARVYLNGKPAGVYVNVERIDRSFLERNFASADGALFKVDHAGPGADLRYLGKDPGLYRTTFELHGGRESIANAALVDFIRAIDTRTGSGADLRRSLDVDAFINTTAVLLLAGAFDQYTGWGPHNYYLYQTPSDHRWTYVPWDLDVGFADHAFGRVPVLEGWHAAWPAPVPARPLMERLISDPGLLQQYRERARIILEKWFKPDVLIPKLRGLYAQIQPALAEDPYPPRRVIVPSDRDYEDIVSSMEQFIRDRYSLAQKQLDAPGDRPPFNPMPGDSANQEPRPGPPSPDAPSNLRVVKVTKAGVELEWVDHAEGEVAFVVQRCTGADCTDFVNAIGQGGENITTAIDRQAQPGMIYCYRVYAVLPTPQGPRGTGVSNVATATASAEQSAR